MALSRDGSGGFASLTIGGSSGATVNGEGGLAGSDASTGGSSVGFVTFAFLDLAWPLRKNIYYRTVIIKIQLINSEEKRIYDYPGAVLKAGNCVCDESPEERDTS